MALRTAGMIEVTGVDLAALVRAAYAPSRQQGLGFFDANGKASGLSDEVVNEILERGRDDRLNAFTIDYLNGRSVKFHVRRSGERLFIQNRWYDHSDHELAALLEQVGLSSDLIQAAREDEIAHRSKVKEVALSYVRERGGEFRQNRGLRVLPTEEEKVPDDVEEGLWIACVDKGLTETYCDDGYILWKLV
jgi:hypothetical protein